MMPGVEEAILVETLELRVRPLIHVSDSPIAIPLTAVLY
jgi:hypothetical protein